MRRAPTSGWARTPRSDERSSDLGPSSPHQSCSDCIIAPRGYDFRDGHLPTFRDAYRLRRCIVPVDGFFEWKAIKGQRPKQPFAIAMKDGTPFGIAGLWENWKEPASGEWIRTFAVITTDANDLVAEIHDRMPAILAPGDYARWLRDEPDPRDLMRPFPAKPMRMWPISTRVNKPENDDPTIVEPVELATDAA
jgi:putative SOS response-associated peptidase YedK